MFLFLKTNRNKMIKKNKVLTYFAYGLGEMILVVLGILLAIQVDDWNKERELNQEELYSYKSIVIDLKRDSVLFASYKKLYLDYLDTYFQMNELKKRKGSFTNIKPDYLVSNIQFNPVTKNNNQITIEKLRNRKVRERINNYFGSLNQVGQATKEFNDLIVQESRPYFLTEKNIFNNQTVFDNQDKTFPPLKRVSTIDTVQLRNVMKESYFLPILSQLRMSIGFYLAGLESSITENHNLIQVLEGKHK